MSPMSNVIQIQDFKDINILPWILILLILNLIISGFLVYKIMGVPNWVYYVVPTLKAKFIYSLTVVRTKISYVIPAIKTRISYVIPAIKTRISYVILALKTMISYGITVLKTKTIIIRAKRRKKIQPFNDESLYKLIQTAGYSYDPIQDIFFSYMDPWQRKMGYCRLYDEAAAPLEMIVDCEPVNFTYNGKRWLIEFWKGQYCLNTGGEIGVYTTEEPDLDISEVFTGTYYNSASNEDRLQMSYSLIKNGEILFKRDELHWWLTGFKLGEFSEPSELTMEIKITLKDEIMLYAFVEGLENIGYTDTEIFIYRNTVSFIYDKTHTPRPITRTPETDWMIQRYNEQLCKKYQKITGTYNSFPEKVKAIQEQAPEIYNAIVNIGKTRQLFKIYKKIKKYLN